MGAIESATCCRVSRPNVVDPSLILLAPHAHPDSFDTLTLVIRGLEGVPRSHHTLERLHAAKSGHFCEVWVAMAGDPARKLLHRTSTQSLAPDGTIMFADESFSISRDKVKTLWISVWCSYLETTYTSGFSRLVGEAQVAVDEVADRPSSQVWMFDSSELLVYDYAQYQSQPLCIVLGNPKGTASAPDYSKCKKHVMVLTRGTRGDVQPFLAVARGLCESDGWRFTLVTEARYKELVLKNAKVKSGAIEFRPSGGDTESRIDRPIEKWWMTRSHRAFQIIMLARAEREFFDSEPAFHYWAQTLRPDVIMFGFNTANLAMIVSESLKIPVVGFILQPTVVPSSQYPAIVPIGRKYHVDPAHLSSDNLSRMRHSLENLTIIDPAAAAADGPSPSPSSPPSRNSRNSETADPGTDEDPDETTVSYLESLLPDWDHSWAIEVPTVSDSHAVVGLLKNLSENNIFSRHINAMRASHGLPPVKTNEGDYAVLTRQDAPLVIPINPFCFGGRPPDWGHSMIMTDFVFLSPAAAPGQEPLDLLAPELKKFIVSAREDGKPIVAIAFSSMPVGRSAILGLSALVAEQSKRGARVIALVGTRPTNEVTQRSVQARADELKTQNKLIEVGGAPFGVLFPLVDFVVVHGGLGTTSEAFRAGKPLLVTGVLLLDQRFWGRRVAELGVGPNPCLVRKLPKFLVGYVDKALEPANEWAKNAQMLAQMLADQKHGDGVAYTCQTIKDVIASQAKVVIS